MTGAVIAGVLVLLAAAGAVGYAVSVYNSLVQVRNNIDKAWSNIDVLLQQRHDELIKLIDACKAYLTHEKGVLDELTRLRVGYGDAKTSDEKAKAENAINKKLDNLRAVWESYPNLRSSENFQQVQGRISSLESAISDRRELFNDSVNIYNIQIQRFPEQLLAGALGYQAHAFLDVPDEAKKDVKMDFGKAPA